MDIVNFLYLRFTKIYNPYHSKDRLIIFKYSDNKIIISRDIVTDKIINKYTKH